MTGAGERRFEAGTRVLVTGAGGFIASHLIPRLLESDCRILAQEPAEFANRLAVFGDSIERLDGGWGERATETAAAAFAPEFVFHLAGHTNQSHSRENDEAQFADHLGAALAVVRSCFGSTLTRMVATSTNEEYGHHDLPHREEVREQPVSAYSAAKAAVTHYFGMLHRSEGLPVVLVRPFLVYGPGQGRGMLHAVGRLALRNAAIETTDGTQTRDFVYVADVVEGLLAAATTPGIDGELFNLGTGCPTPVRTVVEKLCALAGGGKPQFGALPQREGDFMASCADTSKAQEGLGWEARVSLDEGLSLTLESLRSELDSA